MIKTIQRIFTPRTTEEVMREQMYEAEREAIEHEAAAEHHRALADMYSARARRLQERLQPQHGEAAAA